MPALLLSRLKLVGGDRWREQDAADPRRSTLEALVTCESYNSTTSAARTDRPAHLSRRPCRALSASNLNYNHTKAKRGITGARTAGGLVTDGTVQLAERSARARRTSSPPPSTNRAAPSCSPTRRADRAYRTLR